MHERIYNLDCAWAQHLEGSYFPKGVLKDYSQRGKQLWYLDHGSRSLVRSDHCNTVVVRWVVRELGSPWPGSIRKRWWIRYPLRHCARRSCRPSAVGGKRSWLRLSIST